MTNYAMSRRNQRVSFNDILPLVEPAYQEEIKKIADFRKLPKKFDPVLVLSACAKPLSERYRAKN